MEKYILMNHKKSQVWGFDIVIAITIFLVGVIAAYLYAINFLNESEQTLDSLFSEGNFVSSLILSSGTPNDWVNSEVEIPGILSEGKINQTKLDKFYELTENPEGYKNIKNLLATKYNFYFNFTGIEASGSQINGVGNYSQNPENIVKIERLTVYKNKPVKFIIYMWN